MSVDVFITGIAGELGSNFAKLCVEKGFKVGGCDITRFNEAWRLKWLGIEDRVDYKWKATFDLNTRDIDGSWLVFDCACNADRPFGTLSPIHTLQNNLLGPTVLLESAVGCHPHPIMMYPSSCNVFLGVPRDQQPLTESTPPAPTNYYGWSKMAAEELYNTYNRAFGLPVVIIRTGSCYGEGMRSDQFIARCILYMLNDKDFNVRSPEASRTYTYAGDVLEFYVMLIDELWDGHLTGLTSATIHNGGNAEDKPYKTIEVAEMIKKLTGSSGRLLRGKYESGEIINGEPVMQWEKSELAFELLGWKPKHTLEQGLRKTIKWFEERLDEYVL